MQSLFTKADDPVEILCEETHLLSRQKSVSYTSPGTPRARHGGVVWQSATSDTEGHTSDGAELTDGGAWTDGEAISILRQRMVRAKGHFLSDDDMSNNGRRASFLPAFSEMEGPDHEEVNQEASAASKITPWGSFICVSLCGLCAEFGWAVSEAVLMPHMTKKLGISLKIASLVWLINPIFSIVVQPTLGVFMDNYENQGFGRRRPIILAIGAMGALGYVCLMGGEYLCLALRLPHIVLTCTILISFGVVDCAHDTILIPGRVLIGDIAESLEDSIYETGHAVFTSFQALGRLCATACGVLHLYGLGLYAYDDVYHSLFTVAIFVRIFCCCVVAYGTQDCDPCHVASGSHLDSSSVPSSSKSSKEEDSRSALDAGTWKKSYSTGDMDGLIVWNGNKRKARTKLQNMPVFQHRQRRRRWALPLPSQTKTGSWDPVEGDDEEIPESGLSAMMDLLEERGMVIVVLVLGVVGWTSLLVSAFYWTLWIGMDQTVPGTNVKLSFASLLCQSMMMYTTSLCIPWANQYLGQVPTFIGAHIVSVVCLAMTPFWTGPWAALTLGCFLGIPIAVHPNNSLAICETMVDNARLRGTVVAVVNSTLPISQTIVALLSGMCISYFDGDVAMYFLWTAAIHGLILVVATLLFLIEWATDT